jgi:hypothetical protein
MIGSLIVLYTAAIQSDPEGDVPDRDSGPDYFKT